MSGILIFAVVGFVIALSHHKILRGRIIGLMGSLDYQQRHGKTIQTILEKVHLPSGESFSTGDRITRKIKQLAETHCMTQLVIKELPQHLLYEKEEVQVMITPVQITFLVDVDDHFWEFLKELQTKIPGVIISKVLSLEKVNEGDKTILKGSYRFEWYILCRSPEKF